MPRQLSFWLVLALSHGVAASAPGQAPPAVAEVVETARAFSRTAVTAGLEEALLEYLADGAVVLRPHLGGARSWSSPEKSAQAMLAWWPVWAVASNDGSLACTAGPWEHGHGEDSLQLPSFGDHLSVWRKQSDGAWRVVLDLGTTRPARRRADHSLSWPRPIPVNADLAIDAPAERERLLALDRAFQGAAGEEGKVAAYERVAAKDLRLYLDDRFPAVGWSAVRKVLLGATGALAWEPRVAEVAASGDLAYTFGDLRRGEERAAPWGNYVRVWRRDGRGAWRLLAEIHAAARSGTQR